MSRPADRRGQRLIRIAQGPPDSGRLPCFSIARRPVRPAWRFLAPVLRPGTAAALSGI